MLGLLHHPVFCLTTGPKPPLKRFLHIVRSRASSFKWQYPLLSLRSYSSFLRLLPPLLVTSIHSVFCLTTVPKPPPKRFLHIVRSTASSFKWQYPLLSLRSSSSFLRLLPPLLVTSIHSVFCLTTGPKPPLKRFLHIVRSRASSFKWEYPLLSLRSSFSILSDDRSKASSKTVPPHSAI